MLGFTPLSEAPLGEGVPIVRIFGYLDSAAASFVLTNVLFEAIANITTSDLVHTIISPSITSYLEDVLIQAKAEVVPLALELNIAVESLSPVANANILPSSLLLNIRNKDLQYTLNNFIYLNTAYSADRILYLNALETRNNTVYVDDKYVTVIYILSNGVENPVVHILPNDNAVIKLNSLLDSNKTLYV